ncbi:MAG: hypothetical protein AAB360_01915 [Patescibacteria group bacterium]
MKPVEWTVLFVSGRLTPEEVAARINCHEAVRLWVEARLGRAVRHLKTEPAIWAVVIDLKQSYYQATAFPILDRSVAYTAYVLRHCNRSGIPAVAFLEGSDSRILTPVQRQVILGQMSGQKACLVDASVRQGGSDIIAEAYETAMRLVHNRLPLAA